MDRGHRGGAARHGPRRSQQRRRDAQRLLDAHDPAHRPQERGGRDWYETIPLSIIITQSAIITVCMQDTPVLHPFMEGTIRGFNKYMKTRFILQILYRNATM